ncbi:MAG: hypothetical protein A2583_14740 [Bdellovibrionales bacterium RIFOXYD1_FULL_53_11]|nr:MAG: hypothetical protein A2583_14740 [Bdellovibrionales bacterium RIFOXYD1_FULL_53_11]
MTPDECISSRTERWDSLDGNRYETLLRLAVLRDIARDLHAERSRCLATGLVRELKEVRSLEATIELLKNAASLHGNLPALLKRPPEGSRQRQLPSEFPAGMEAEKFERFDRLWEKAISAEAAREGWRFWLLDAWVGIRSAQQFHIALGEKLLPRCIVLFAESIPPCPGSETPPELWHGRWYVTLEPDVDHESLGIGTIPGVFMKPAPPAWTFLFARGKTGA